MYNISCSPSGLKLICKSIQAYIDKIYDRSTWVWGLYWEYLVFNSSPPTHSSPKSCSPYYRTFPQQKTPIKQQKKTVPYWRCGSLFNGETNGLKKDFEKRLRNFVRFDPQKPNMSQLKEHPWKPKDLDITRSKKLRFFRPRWGCIYCKWEM